MHKNKWISFISLVLVLVVCFLALYSILYMNTLSSLLEKQRNSESISLAALDFNVENFHTQLEVWEYAFEPNYVRWVAFQSHEEKLLKLLDNLVILADVNNTNVSGHSSVTIYDGGKEDIKTIALDLDMVRSNWLKLFEVAKKIEDVKEKGYDKFESENHSVYMAFETELRDRMEENELLFDELDFNSKVDDFIKKQESLLDSIVDDIYMMKDRFKMILISLVGFLVVLSFFIVFFLMWPYLKKEGRKK